MREPILIIALCAACAAPRPHITTESLSPGDGRVHQTTNAVLEGGSRAVALVMNLRIHELADGERTCFVQFESVGAVTYEPLEGESMRLVLDGGFHRLPLVQTFVTDLPTLAPGGTAPRKEYVETSLYRATPALFRALAAAEHVEVHVAGKTGVEGRASPLARESYALFVETFLPGGTE